jgi:DNA-binding NtrC family response regulator
MAMLQISERQPVGSRGLRELLEDYERTLIASALQAAGGNQRRAARALGVLPSTLCEKMKRLGLRSRTVYTTVTAEGQ